MCYSILTMSTKRQAIIPILILIAAGMAFGQDRSTKTVDDLYELEVVENLIKSDRQNIQRSRHLFIYIPENKFTLENITEIFDAYQSEFCDPYILRIELYSDKDMLRKKLAFEKLGFAIDFNDDEAGRNASQEFYGRVLPNPTGYLRAEYARFGDYELFDYTKTKEHIANTRVFLKKKDLTRRSESLNKCRRPETN